jgi:hypothetical protein
MNIIQIHNKIRVLLDNEDSPRHRPKNIDEIINTAIALIVDDRYDNEKQEKGQKKYSFQSSAKLRDQLYTLVKKSGWIVAEGDTIPSTGYPSDFNYLIGPNVDVSGIETHALPLAYDEESTIHLDPKRRPSIIYPPRVYYIEYQSGLRIIWGAQGALIRAQLYYLKKPAVVSYGVEIPVDETLVQGAQIIGVTDSVVYKRLVASPEDFTTVSIASGETYAVPVDVLYVFTFQSGISVKNAVNCDLPNNMHEEVSRRAAALISGTVENYNKKNDLMKEDKL